MRIRVIIMAIVGVLMISGAALFVFIRYEQTVASGREITQVLIPVAGHSNQLTADISELDRSIQVYVATGSPQKLQAFNALYQDAITQTNTIQAHHESEFSEISIQAGRTKKSLETWYSQIAVKAIAATKDGNSTQARTYLTSVGSLALFDEIEKSDSALTQAIHTQWRQASTETDTFVDQLGRTLAVASLFAILAFGLSIFLVIRWFLKPLDQLRRQLRNVARRGHQNDPIIPNGPPEIAAAGSDAELMRRELVSHQDEAQAAVAGLAQEGPVVTEIRELLAPSNHAADSSTLRIAGSSQAAEGVMGGDWWDSFTLRDGRILTVVTDISGHGSDVAITALNSKISIADAVKDTNDIEVIAAYLAECFSDSSFEATQADDRNLRFATSVLMIFDPHTYSLEWINAGHPPPIVIGSTGVIAELDPTGPIMSTLGGTWAYRTLKLAPGHSVVAWSDGLSESRDHQGKFLDDEGVATLVEQLNYDHPISADRLVPLVLNNVRQKTNHWQHDDITLVIMQVR